MPTRAIIDGFVERSRTRALVSRVQLTSCCTIAYATVARMIPRRKQSSSCCAYTGCIGRIIALSLSAESSVNSEPLAYCVPHTSSLR